MHTQLELPASPEALPLIQAHARALAALVGFDAKRTAAIELACEEAFGLILERVSGASASPWPTPSVSAPCVRARAASGDAGAYLRGVRDGRDVRVGRDNADRRLGGERHVRGRPRFRDDRRSVGGSGHCGGAPGGAPWPVPSRARFWTTSWPTGRAWSGSRGWTRSDGQRARSACAISAALVHGTRQTLHAVHQLRGRIVRKTQAHGLCEAEAADEP